jgi:hypothetical protein
MRWLRVALVLLVPYAAALAQAGPRTRTAPVNRQPVASAQAPGNRQAAANLPGRTARTQAPEQGSDLTVSLITMGPGAQIWEQFGHNAILFHVERAPSEGGPVDVLYNWGVFDFAQPNFIPRFLRGRMLYTMGGFTLESTMEDYRARDRSVWEQQLDLTNAQKVALRDLVLTNALPQNRDYYYDYFRDNCSTRVRDMLDRMLQGALKTQFGDRLTGHSYRWHTRRLTQVGPWLYTGIDIGLGRPADREISAWEEMFLPEKLREYVREVRITDSAGASRPLVKNERVLYESRNHREPESPPRWWPIFAAIGLVTAALFAWLGSRDSANARIWAGVVFSLWSLAAGILGTLLVLLWTVTHHVFAHRNENVLLFNPTWLALVVLIPVTLATGRWRDVTRRTMAAAGALSLIALLLHVVFLSRQANWEIIALALPATLVITWSVMRATGRLPSRA